MSDEIFSDTNSCVSVDVDIDIIPIPTSPSISTVPRNSSYTPNQLQLLLKYEKQKFRILNNDSMKTLASWWRSFGYPSVLNEKNEFERIPGFISCLKCCCTYNYGPSTGTRHIINHADRCTPPVASSSSPRGTDNSHSAQHTLDKNVVKQNVKLPIKEQNEIKELYAKWICRDIRPYSIVEDQGFEDLAQMFIRIGAQYGLVDVKEVMRSRQTVGRSVDELATKYRSNLQNELAEPLKAKSIPISPDFWSNKYNQQSYLGLNITFVNADHEFKSIDLFCVPVTGVKSYDLILDVIRRELSLGANFVKAFALYNPLYCFGHRLNNILKICFFQNERKKKTKHNLSPIDNGATATVIRKTNVNPAVPDGDSSNDSDSESLECEDDDEASNLIDQNTLINFQKRKSSTGTTAQKMSVNDIPPEAKKVILLLKQTKRLVQHVKQVNL